MLSAADQAAEIAKEISKYDWDEGKGKTTFDPGWIDKYSGFYDKSNGDKFTSWQDYFGIRTADGWWSKLFRPYEWFFAHEEAAMAIPPAAFPDNPSVIGHIFSGVEGHYRKDTPANRAEIQSVTFSKYLLGTSKHGVSYYARLNPDGTQTWAYVRRFTIVDGGLNLVPVYGVPQLPGH